MKHLTIAKSLILPLAIGLLAFTVVKEKPAPTAQTEITKWQDGKTAAVSITYDDGSINQFKYALPVMNRLKIPATFFIITGPIPGSKYQGRFIGRPVAEIIKESATIPTNKDNLFERASAAPFLGYAGTVEYHTKAGSALESGKAEQAYKIMDDLYQKVRNGEFKPGDTPNDESKQEAGLTWDDIRTYARQGHEFASHTVTHAMTPVLDEPNLLYELQKSKEDILTQLGPKYTFSAECSYGVENDRAIQYALKIYPALRNRMPEPWLDELNRSSRKTPGTFGKEYVQWQRGATTKTPLPMMKSWVDTVATHSNNWLVLVIHGVDGLGYEALSHELLDEYFQYIRKQDDKLWIATFGDVTKYMRERMAAKVETTEKGGKVMVNLTHSLDKTMYNIPLTLKTYVSSGWKQVQVKQGTESKRVPVLKDGKGTYVLYQAAPNTKSIELSGV